MQAMPGPASVAPFNASMLLQVSIERICGSALPVLNGHSSSLPLFQSGFTATQLAEQRIASSTQAAAVAQLLVTGNLGATEQHLPQAGAAVLVQAYDTAFDRLLIVLAAITVMTAIVVFLGPRRGAASERETAALPACQEG